MAKRRLSAKEGNKLYKTGSIVPAERDKHEPKHKGEGTAVGTASKCLEEIRRYDKQAEPWERRGKDIIARYRDERDNTTSGQRCFNILWSNTQVLKPTLYARQPKTEVIRRFKDQDKVAKIGAEIAERATDTEIERAGLHDVLQQATLDLLLPGRAVAWVSYDPTFQGEDKQRVKTDDGIVIDYVDWRDFGHNTAPVWQKVTKVWRWKYFDKPAVKKRFKDHAKWIDKLEFAERRTQDKNEPETKPEARIAEVWDRVTKKVYWVHKSVPDYLDEYDDPLHLQGFFPCPKPLYSTTTNNTLVPVPHFYLYQDQANEVDKLTGRINRLTDALKIVGVYDKTVNELQDLMSPSGVADNTLVPVDMNDLTGKGGLVQAVQLVDISQVIETIQACYIARQQAIDAIYQITGISDILRGDSDPRETKGAQEIKAQFGGTRIRDMQQDVAAFARDIIRICAEIIVEMYEPQKLWEMTNAESFVGPAPAPPPQPGQPPAPPQPNVELFAQAVRLLRDDKLRSYRVDIETDSTIAMDEAEAKQEAVEFMKVMGDVLGNGLQMVAQIPQATQFFGEALLFVARRFKAGRTLEGSIETMVEQLGQAAQQPKQDPEMIKVQGEMAIMQEKMKLMQMQAQIKAAEGQQKLQLERELAQLEIQIKAMELQMEQRKTEMEISADAAKHRQEMSQMQQKGAIETRLAQQQGQQQLRMGEQKMDQQKQIGDQKVTQAKQLAQAKPANARPA